MKSDESSDEAEKNEFDEHASLATSIYWLKAVIEQGKRIKDAHDEPIANTNSSIWNSRAQMEEQFFLTACAKAQRWLTPMKLRCIEAANFEKLGESIKKVRDEREHDEERYGLGKKFDTDNIDPMEHAEAGYLRKIEKPGKTVNPHQKFRMEPSSSNTGVKIISSMSVTDLRGGRILLGGIVDVGEVICAASGLMTSLLYRQHSYWDRKMSLPGQSEQDNSEAAKSYYINPQF